MKTVKVTKDMFDGLTFKVDVNVTGIPRCGCTQTEPHSHLVYGYQCECEKGVPEPPKAELT